MKPEPKSIFTSEKDFGTQAHSIRGRVAPPVTPSATSQISPSPQSAANENGWGAAEGYTQFGGVGETLVDGGHASAIDVKNTESDVSQRKRGTKNFPPANAPHELHGQPPIPPIDGSRSRIPDAFLTQQSLAPPPPSPSSAKHPRSEDDPTKPVSNEPPSKRNRPKVRPRHTLDPEAVQAAKAKSKRSEASLPSPLFFSHTPRHRPVLHPDYSSADAAAAMLNEARDEPSRVTSLKIARGSVGAASPPRPSSTPGIWPSFDGSHMPGTPDMSSASSSILNNIGVVELLEQDERPTFIIDVAEPLNFSPGNPLHVLFANPSLRASEPLLEMVTGNSDLNSPGIAVTTDFPAFKHWALSYVKNGEALNIALPSFMYNGIAWNCSTLRKRFRLISGSGSGLNAPSLGSGSLGSGPSIRGTRVSKRNSLHRSPLVQSSELSDYFGNASPPAAPSTPLSPEDILSSPLPEQEPVPPRQAMLASQTEETASGVMSVRYPEAPSFDWTRLPLSAALPKHIQFARSIDWGATPLGPIETWTFDLRAMCNLIMASPHPAAMYWGPEYIAIYNEAYILLAGKKHPQLMGQSYKDAWAEIWDEIKEVFDSALESGRSTMKDDDCLFIRRDDFLEETYFSWSIIPLVGEDGSVVGLYNPGFEKTRRKIGERRMLTLREVGDRTATAREVQEFWGQVITGLEYNQYDVPFVFLYSVSEDNPDSDMSSMHSSSLSQSAQCVLEGTLGVPQGHKAASSPLDLKASDEGFAPHLRESMKTMKPVLLTIENGMLSSDLIEGLEWRGFGDPCRSAVVCPIHPTNGETILGFLVMGINPRRPFDDDYSLFITLLSRQLATSMASVVLFEEEIKRGQRAARLAALDRQELSKQLDLRTQEAVESETKFTRMAEFAPVGMFIADSAGKITYSNDTWWEISRHPRSENSVNSWMDSIKDEDRESVQRIWKALVEKKTAVTHEFRFRTPWQGRNGTIGDTWALMSAYPERDSEGKLKSVFGCITNISQQKWAEGFQKRRMEEAIEMKRQQENFIDMTSHEMRNPLSAILQCSDEISTSLTLFKSSEDAARAGDKLIDCLDGSIDAAQTIALCAQHQKRIVDDILTLSKLDAALLMVTPVAVQPVAVVQRALKMFEGELDTNDIAMEFRMEKSYFELAIDWVKLDPSRLLQVLINLTTNAIKFTHGQEKRTIIVSVGASTTRPDGYSSDVTYFPSRSKSKDVTADVSEWGDGEELYLHFAVQDTGRGLDPKEKTLLFQRFSQASPRTHVQYGGSGLGLFISRELTELQGGEIGVLSERGVGSTFAFFVKARRMDNMNEDTPMATTINSLRRNSSNSAVTVTLESRRNSSGKASVHRSNTTGSHRRPPPSTSSLPLVPAPLFVVDHTLLTILIVEDNLVNQRVLQKQLLNLGFRTELANHGLEALNFLKTTNFWRGKEEDGRELAVILMDLEMPVMDGLTCARKIRELEVGGGADGRSKVIRHVPIIAVTANARMEQIETAMSAGMDDVVCKPFRIPELIPKIDELVSKFNAASISPHNATTNVIVPKLSTIPSSGSGTL